MTKCFPPLLNNVSTLPCKTWDAHCACATHHCYQLLPTETPEFIALQLWCPNSLDLNPAHNSMWEILQEKVYKTLITDLQLPTTPLTNGCRNDDIIVKIESVQRSFTKRLPGLSNLPYAKRLEVLGIDSLEIRRLRYDLLFCVQNVIWSCRSEI